jgi:uncharacterized membrane protein
MGVGDANLERRLEQLAERLGRVERHLNLGPSESKTPQDELPAEQAAEQPNEMLAALRYVRQKPAEQATSRTAPSDAPQSPVPSATAPPTSPPPKPTPAQTPPPRAVPQPTAPSKPAASPPSPPSPPSSSPATAPASPVASAPTTAQKPAQDDRSIEFAIGGKIAAWVGAIIIVLGTGFAIREYGAGVWSTLPNVAQAFIIAAFGGLLILAGEVALRKIGTLASVGMFGAGLGVLYLTAYSTFAWFEPAILSSNGAFVLMALVALGGFAITLRTRFLTIGVLSLVGGYLTPILLSGGGGAPLAAFSYLTMLPAIALGLAAALPASFRHLRSVALGGQIIVGLMLVLAFASAHWIVALVFVTIWWAMFIGEATLAALHDRSANHNAITTLLATAAYVTCATVVLAHFAPAGSPWLGAFTLGVAVLSAAIATQITSGLDVLKSMSPRAVDRLGVALLAQAGVLLAVAAALQFDGYGISVSWLALGLAGIEIGRRVESKGATIFGLIVGALACAKVATIDQFISALNAVIWSWGELQISGWALLGLFAIAAVHIAARRVGEHRGEFWRAMPILLTITATGGWVLWCMTTVDGLLLTSGWLLGSAALLIASPFGVRQRYLEIGLVLLLMTAGKWLIIDAFGGRFAPGWDATAVTPLLNPQMAVAVAIGIVAVGAFMMLRRRDHAASQAMTMGDQQRIAQPGELGFASLWSMLILAGSVFLLIAMSFEIDRYVIQLAASAEALLWQPGHLLQVMFTMLWSLGALGIGVIGTFLIRDATRDHFALRVLLGFAWFILLGTLTKWVLIDTLFWHATTAQEAVIGLTLFGNAQMLAGIVLAASAVGLLLVTMRVRTLTQVKDGQQTGSAPAWSMLTHIVPPAAAMIVLWGLSFEVDRLLGVIAAGETFTAVWPHAQWVALWLTGLWATGGMAMMLSGRWRAMPVMMLAGWFVIVLGAIAWLSADTVYWRLMEGAVRATPMMNLQFMIGLATAVLLACGMIVLRHLDPRSTFAPMLASSHRQRSAFTNLFTMQAPLALTLITIIGFWLGSFEIDRAFIDNAMARQVGWSVFWATYGVALVLIGFVRLAPAARYAGLALLCATVAKVMVIDLAQVDQIWRVVSFLVLGLLLLATSVAYMKFAPRLLQTIQSQPARSP